MKASHRGPARREEAFSLLELTLALTVFAVVTIISVPFLGDITSVYSDSRFRSSLMESAKVAQERLVDELFSAKVLSVTTVAGLPVLTYVVPLELFNGARTDFLDANGDVNWGAVENGGPMVDTRTDRHQVSLILLPTRKVREADVHLDINRDGDLQDTFQLGSLIQRTTGGRERILSFDRLVLDALATPIVEVTGETFIDSNANGIRDPGEAFTDANLNGYWDGCLSLNLVVFSTDRKGQGQSFIYRSRIRLRNN